MRVIDVVLAVAILGGALLLLYRSLRRSGAGGCHGCSGSCAKVKQPGLVQLSGADRGCGPSPKRPEGWPPPASCDTHR